jgi:hypothetical protein
MIRNGYDDEVVQKEQRQDCYRILAALDAAFEG